MHQARCGAAGVGRGRGTGGEGGDAALSDVRLIAVIADHHCIAGEAAGSRKALNLSSQPGNGVRADGSLNAAFRDRMAEVSTTRLE